MHWRCLLIGKIFISVRLCSITTAIATPFSSSQKMLLSLKGVLFVCILSVYISHNTAGYAVFSCNVINMKKLHYRPARRDDVAALCVIEQQSFASDQLSRAAFNRSVSAPTQLNWVAVSEEDLPVGYLLLHFRKNSKHARIYSIAVLQSWRGKGIAKQLLRQAIDAACERGCKVLGLEVRKTDQKVIDFYLAQRFSPRKMLPAYYGDGGDAISMFLDLAADSAGKPGLPREPRRVGTIIVVPRPQDMQILQKSFKKRQSTVVVTAREYLLMSPDQARAAKVINLCPGDEYLSSGYYVSLVAEARGSTAIPSVDALSSLEAKRIYEDYLAELNQLLPKTPILSEKCDPAKTDSFSLEFYFGRTDQQWARRLAKRCYQLFNVPVLEVMIVWHLNQWKVDYVWPLSIAAIDPPDQGRFIREMNDAVSPASKSVRQTKRHFFDLAILVDPDEALPPSNSRALQLMVKAADKHDMHCEFITKADFKRLEAFDALLIRSTTTINHFTYQFAMKAAQFDMPVIDDPRSILRCSNKVFLFEALGRAGVAMPKTTLLTRGNLNVAGAALSFPQVIKIPDGSFSRGVIKVSSSEEFHERARQMLENSYVILAQDYMPTEYDWRIGVLNGQPLFAAKYLMARGHWQIYHHKQNKKVVSGGFETVPLDDVPQYILKTAITAGLTIGNGLYGVDLKDIDRRAVVIEVNDNPNIDAGVEDKVAGTDLYDRLMTTFLDRIRKSKGIVYT